MFVMACHWRKKKKPCLLAVDLRWDDAVDGSIVCLSSNPGNSSVENNVVSVAMDFFWWTARWTINFLGSIVLTNTLGRAGQGTDRRTDRRRIVMG